MALTAPNILGVIAAIFIALSGINYFRKGKINSMERTWLIVAGIFMLVIIYLQAVVPRMMGDAGRNLTYRNIVYGYSFQYPENSLLYSDVAADGKSVVPPNNDVVCVSEGKAIPGVDNDDPEFFCVEVYKNTTLDGYLKSGRGISLAEIRSGIDSTVFIKNGDVVNLTRQEIFHQLGPNLIRLSGSYFTSGDQGTYSNKIYATFTTL